MPLVFDAMHGEGHIVVVISPLLSLMKGQVQKLKNLGISVVTLSDIKEEDVKAVEKGVFSCLWKSRGFLENRMMETNTNKQCLQGKVVRNGS